MNKIISFAKKHFVAIGSSMTVLGSSALALSAHATADAFDTAQTSLTDYVQTFLSTHVPEVFTILAALTAMGVLYAIVRRRIGKKI